MTECFSQFQETSLVLMSEGLLLHQSLLSNISTHLGPQDTVTELLTDIRDLLFHIRKVIQQQNTLEHLNGYYYA